MLLLLSLLLLLLLLLLSLLLLLLLLLLKLMLPSCWLLLMKHRWQSWRGRQCMMRLWSRNRCCPARWKGRARGRGVEPLVGGGRTDNWRRGKGRGEEKPWRGST